MSRNEMIQCFLGAKIIQTLVLQALANTSHSWQRSRVFRPKFLVNILRFGSKKTINIHQPKANLPILTRFSRHAWWLNSLQDSPWHHGIRVRGQPGCWCSAAQQMERYARLTVGTVLTSNPDITFTFWMLKRWKTEGVSVCCVKTTTFRQSLAMHGIQTWKYTRASQKRTLWGKHHWGVLPVTPVLLDFILISACLSLQEPGFYTYCILLLHLLATLKYRSNMWNVVCFFVILPTPPNKIVKSVFASNRHFKISPSSFAENSTIHSWKFANRFAASGDAFVPLGLRPWNESQHSALCGTSFAVGSATGSNRSLRFGRWI